MFHTLSYALARKWDVLSRVAKMAWDVLPESGKNGIGCFVGVANPAWDVLSGRQILVGYFVQGVKNRHGMFDRGV